MTNKLIKYVEQLRKQHQDLATQVEEEEEYITNTLQKRLDEVTKEKVDLENRLEQEEEYIMNKMMAL